MSPRSASRGRAASSARTGARRASSRDRAAQAVDFGLVGDVEGIDRALLDALDAGGYLPVVACLGADAGGTTLNINADVVASQLAASVGAAALVACTAVGGVRRDKDDPATRIARLTVAEARAAIHDGVVQGG